MEDYLTLAANNREKALRIVRRLDIPGIWAAAGVEVRQVGSLRMGLMMKHRDIDFHLYSDPVDIAADFATVARIAACPGITHVEYTNLLGTEEDCLEWHAWYTDGEGGEPWQIDMIHIRRGSRYDGYFEQVADRITAALTPETRDAILRLKYETPASEKIMGIEYYQAVLRDGIRTYGDFTRWRRDHPAGGIIEWMP